MAIGDKLLQFAASRTTGKVATIQAAAEELAARARDWLRLEESLRATGRLLSSRDAAVTASLAELESELDDRPYLRQVISVADVTDATGIYSGLVAHSVGTAPVFVGHQVLTTGPAGEALTVRVTFSSATQLGIQVHRTPVAAGAFTVRLALFL